MIPSLPDAEIRAAVQCGEWTLAGALLARHDAELRAALAAADLAASPQPWQQLLQAQRGLLAELARQRDEAGAELARVDRDHRVARAYLQEA